MRFRDTMSSVLLAALVAAAGCSEDTETMTAQPDASTADAAPSVTPWDELLAQRQQNYGQALRVASLKLRGGLPTLAETKAVTESGDPDGAYRAVLQTYLEDPRFAVQMRNFFRDSFRMGGGQLDTAPSFAAQLVVEDRNFTELFTASAQTCPTLDEATGQFAPGECTSGAPQTAGLLTNPHVMRHFFSNMAFRRVMWLQETFVCTKFPAEVDVPQDVGGAAAYVAPWAFDSVAGTETGGVIDFRDAESVVCANCHGTMNHQAPLFARFDEEGMWQTDYAVPTPAEGAPTVRFEDYLATGETPAWRFDQPVADLADFGQAMAADPDVAECMVARVWNLAMGKGDIVAALAHVPPDVIANQVIMFQTNGHKLKDVIFAVFTSDDFLKW